MKTHSLNPYLLQRLADKRAGKYRSPLAPSYRSTWGGTPWQIRGTRTWGRFLEAPETGFDFTGLAHKLVKLKHTGWYVQHDDDYSETTQGVVYRCIGKRAWLAACTNPWQYNKDGHGPCIVEVKPNGQPYFYDSPEEAARAADSLAETYAECCREDDREYQERQILENEIEEAQSAIVSSRDEARALVAEIRESNLSPALCARLRGQVQKLRAAMHYNFREVRNLTKQVAALEA